MRNDGILPYEFQEMAKIGWWEADFEKNTFTCSEFITDVMQLESSTMTFECFLDLIRPDHRERVELNFFVLKQFDAYDEIFPIKTPHGYQWIHAKFGNKRESGSGHYIVRGYAQYMSEYRMQEAYSTDINLQLNDLLTKYNNISHSLLSFLKTTDTDKIIHGILNDILQLFEGDTIYIFEYDWEQNIQNCIYKIIREGAKTGTLNLQNMPVGREEWWHKQILDNKPIIINNVFDEANLPEYIKSKLIQENIFASLVAPLSSREEAWGYMGMDMTGKAREWNRIDYEWFASLSNIVSICIMLRRSETIAQKEQEKLKKANETISLKEKKLQNIYKNIPVGIEFYDRNGILVDVNDTELEIFGFPDKQAAIGIDLFKNPNLPEHALNELLNDRDVDFELDFHFSSATKDYLKSNYEGIKKLSVKCTVLKDSAGNRENYMMIIIDNTATLGAYYQLAEFESFFTYIAEFAEIGLSQWNPITKTGFAIEQWFKNMNEDGHELKDIIGVYNTVHPDDVGQLMTFYDEVIRGNATQLRCEIRIKNGDQWKWIRKNLKVKEYDPKHNNVKVIGLNIDLSELKRTEAKLIEAKTKAEESDRLKSAFLANMSHEIRTPLNSIVGFSSILAETENEEDRIQYQNIIQKNNDLLLQLITDILDLSKIEAGTLDVSYNNLDVNELCVETIRPFLTSAPKEVELSFEKHLPECTIYCDKNRLTQVISNLISNALKFTPRGFIRVGYETTGDFIEFYVCDSGIGIAPEQHEKVFERFIKLNNFSNGTGLGLPICRNIIEKMGGQIGVRSELDKGAHFWFRLPLIPEEEKEEPIIPATQKKGSNPDKLPVILVAEDSESNFILVDSILKWDYKLIHAVNGIEAIRLCKEQAPDLILMDIKMPEMDGLTATMLLREENIQIPIIALTAFAFDSDRQKALEAGCNDYIPKPVNATLLKNVLKKYL